MDGNDAQNSLKGRKRVNGVSDANRSPWNKWKLRFNSAVIYRSNVCRDLLKPLPWRASSLAIRVQYRGMQAFSSLGHAG